MCFRLNPKTKDVRAPGFILLCLPFNSKLNQQVSMQVQRLSESRRCFVTVGSAFILMKHSSLLEQNTESCLCSFHIIQEKKHCVQVKHNSSGKVNVMFWELLHGLSGGILWEELGHLLVIQEAKHCVTAPSILFVFKPHTSSSVSLQLLLLLFRKVIPTKTPFIDHSKLTAAL